jgi:hypothetical protein
MECALRNLDLRTVFGLREAEDCRVRILLYLILAMKDTKDGGQWYIDRCSCS